MAEIVETVYAAKAAKFIAASICMSMGALASAMGQGFIGGKFLETLGKNPGSSKDLFTAAMASLIMVETSSLFSLVIALILIFN